MRFIIILSIFSIFSYFFTNQQNEESVLFLSTEKGHQRLIHSSHHDAYWKLSLYYDTQRFPTYCGVATATMILNSLDIERPSWKDNSQFKMFMQEHFFSPEVSKIVTPEEAQSTGISFDQLAIALETFGINVEKHSSKVIDANVLRQSIKDALSSNKYIIVNFNRVAVGQAGIGHFAPVAAYDSATDTVLLMDVARYKYPPAWVSLEQLARAMEIIDEDTGKPRGWMVVSKKTSEK